VPSPKAGPKFQRPKILVVDAPEVTPVLVEHGYAAVSGSFGQPFVVQASSGYLSLTLTVEDLPGYTEQEIIVANLAGPPPSDDLQPEDPPDPGVRRIWAPTASGLVDPRPALMWAVRKAMDRIYRHGGIFIIFASGRFKPRCILSSLDSRGNLSTYRAPELHADNWSLLSDLCYLT
jgi:hypothetical protein